MRGDVSDHHASIVEAAAGRDVWVVGGGDLAAQFADAGLLDLVRVGVAPVTLGAGAPLFPRRVTDRFRLADVTSDGHFAFLDYTPWRRPADAREGNYSDPPSSSETVS